LVAVIGYSFWQERFGGSPDVIGETIDLSDRTYEIVGVAPPGFDFTREAQIWVPLYHDLEGCARGCHFIRFVARLKQGVTVEAAQAELSLLATRLQEEYVDTNYGKEFRFATLAETVYGNVRTGLLVMLGAVSFVLLIACANVANLMLARGTARTGEIAVRSALGASRGRLVAQLLVEALVLAAVGGALGLGLASGGLNALLRIAPSNLPRLDEISVDGTVLLFALGTVTVVTFLFGLMPAFRLASTSVSETLNHSGRGEITSITSAWSRSALLRVRQGTSPDFRDLSTRCPLRRRCCCPVFRRARDTGRSSARCRIGGQCVGKSDGAQFGRRVIQAPRSA
jgi:predicted permease